MRVMNELFKLQIKAEMYTRDFLRYIVSFTARDQVNR